MVPNDGPSACLTDVIVVPLKSFVPAGEKYHCVTEPPMTNILNSSAVAMAQIAAKVASA